MLPGWALLQRSDPRSAKGEQVRDLGGPAGLAGPWCLP